MKRPRIIGSVRKTMGLTIFCLAAATGLSAHLLSSVPAHSGSARDLAVVVALLVAAKVLGGRLFADPRSIACVGVIAACTALGWPFLENGAHVPPADLLATAVWLFPILVVAILSIVAFASVSVAIVRAMVAAFVTVVPRSGVTTRIEDRNRPFKRYRETLRLLRRRGPPMMRVGSTLTT